MFVFSRLGVGANFSFMPGLALWIAVVSNGSYVSSRGNRPSVVDEPRRESVRAEIALCEPELARASRGANAAGF
jgi:hypothetical protein